MSLPLPTAGLVKEKLGVNNTGLPFNSVMAMERMTTGNQ